jgi:outer membrane biosynthesis protein TonB
VTPTGPLQHYQPRGIFSTWLGVVLLFAFFGLLALVILKAAPRGSDYEKKRAEARAKKLEEAQKENLTALTTYGWVDKNKGVVRIPINEAMQIMLVELPDKKPKAAGPIAAPSPSAAPQTSPSAAPSGSPSPSASASASTTPKPTSVSGPHSEAHNQPAAAVNPPPAPPNTQPGPNSSPAASAPPAPANPQATSSPSTTPAAAGTPLPVRGKTP